MKRLVLFFLTMVMCCAFTATALAAPSFYASPNYDLSGLSTIKLTYIDEDIPENKRAVVMPEEKLLGALYKSAQKLRLEFVDARDRDVEVAAKNVGNRIRVGYLEVVINDMSTVKRLVPGRWETRTEYEDRVWYDRDGRKHIDRVPYRHDVWIPETWHIDMRIALLYTLYDENKNVVAKCSDARVRNDEDSPNGMLSRSTADFFKLLIKNGRK